MSLVPCSEATGEGEFSPIPLHLGSQGERKELGEATWEIEECGLSNSGGVWWSLIPFCAWLTSQSLVVCVWPRCGKRSIVFAFRGPEFKYSLYHVLTVSLG